MVRAGFQLPNAPRGFVPVSPATALKVIFMNNMDLSLEQISSRSGVDLSILQSVESGNSKIDSETGRKLQAAFGAAAELLLKIQALHSHYEMTGELAPMELFQEKHKPGFNQDMQG